MRGIICVLFVAIAFAIRATEGESTLPANVMACIHSIKDYIDPQKALTAKCLLEDSDEEAELMSANPDLYKECETLAKTADDAYSAYMAKCEDTVGSLTSEEQGVAEKEIQKLYPDLG